MKKILAALMLLLSFGTMAQVKIGFVDSQKLLDTMPSRKAAIVKYQEHEKKLVEDYQKLQAEVKSMEEEYQKNVGNWTPVIRQSFEKKLQGKYTQLQSSEESIQEELQDYSAELNEPILGRVRNAVKIVSERQKISMVVDKSSTLYSAADMDITSLVVVELLKLEKEATVNK
jgi:outer membrane protein